MTKRVFAAIFGGLLFGILVPVLGLLLDSLPFDSFAGFVLLAVVGAGVGAFLGARFPSVFGFIFQAFTGV